MTFLGAFPSDCGYKLTIIINGGKIPKYKRAKIEIKRSLGDRHVAVYVGIKNSHEKGY